VSVFDKHDEPSMVKTVKRTRKNDVPGGLVVMVPMFESACTQFRFIDNVAEHIDDDTGEEDGDVSGLFFGQYRVNYKGRKFHCGPDTTWAAVEAAVKVSEFPPDYCI